MARIPVQRRRGGGFPWWAWLLIGLILLALLAWLLFALLGDDEAAVAPEPDEPAAVVEPEPTEIVAAEPTPTIGQVAEPVGGETPAGQDQPPPTPQQAQDADGTGPITDLTTIFEEQDKTSLAGRRVDLQGETAAQVQSVVGDTTFWVGPSQDQQVFVALSEEQDAADAEGLVDVNEGQTVRLTGQVQQLPPIEEARQQWGLSEANAAQLENQQIYISAEQVEIAER